MAGKRKHDELALANDAKLAAVTRALGNLRRLDESDEFVSGVFTSYPWPGLRLRGDASDLSLPLTPQAADDIVQKTAVSNKHKGLTWEIASENVHIRNSRWDTQILKMVRAARKPLGISDTAQVEATLNKAVLVREGGQLPLGRVPQSSAVQTSGRFGTLVVMLPSEFTGGEICLLHGAAASAKAQLRWDPHSAEKNAYDVTYAAFYGCYDKLAVSPVTSGVALCLVYDLVTSTILEVPRFAGESRLQHTLEASLAQFFEVLPAHKRFRISDDAWRTINEFVADRRFVYPVRGGKFEHLEGNDQRVAERLAAFCKRSNEQYVLHLTGLTRARRSSSRYRNDENVSTMSLKAPWRRYGESQDILFPPTAVKHRVELAQTEILGTTRDELDVEANMAVEWDESDESDEGGSDESDESDIDNFMYGYRRAREDHPYIHTGRQVGYALVVQPATLEHVLWAKMPVMTAMAKIQELDQTRPDEATRLARRVLSNKPGWANSDPVFGQFLAMVMTLNDAPLFCDLLQSVVAFEFDEGSLSRTVGHFGWDACSETIERIIPSIDFRSRVNLICSVLHGSTSRNRCHQLIDALIKLHPWSDVDKQPSGVAAYGPMRSRWNSNPNSNPSIDEFCRLLARSYGASKSSLPKILNKVKSGFLLVSLFIPALCQFVGGQSTEGRSSFVPKLRVLHNLIESGLPRVRNVRYAACTIPDHCDKCRELQTFLTSTAPQTSLRMRDKAHLKHIQTVVNRKVSSAGPVSVSHVPPNIVLTKESMSNRHSVAAEQCLASLALLIP